MCSHESAVILSLIRVEVRARTGRTKERTEYLILVKELVDVGKMNSVSNISRVLGAAFLLQYFTSLISGLILSQALPGNFLPSVGPVSVNLIDVANNAWLIRANILGQTATAAGVIFLWAMLFVTLRRRNEETALVGFGFYVLEGALLAASMVATFFLLQIGQEYVTAGNPAYLQTIGNLAFESMNFGETLAELPFCLGAILFYYLFYKSRIVPRILSLWGLVGVSLVLIGTLSAIFGYGVSFFVYLPYVPFEFVIGVWILVKGMSDASGTKQ